jgi:hypothetical protein
MKINLRVALILAALALAGGVAACSDTSKPAADPVGPSLDCRGGYLGGGGGKNGDTTGICIVQSAPTDSI